MKRVRVCTWIFAVLIIISAGSLFLMKKQCSELENQIKIIYSLHEEDKTEEEIAEIENLNIIWEKDFKVLCCLVRQDRILELNSSIAKLKAYAKDANDELGGELKSALYYIDMLEHSEMPYLYNIL